MRDEHRGRLRSPTWISASDTPKSRFDTSSFPPVSTPAPPPKPLSKRSCCHLSGSCFGCRQNREDRETREPRPGSPRHPTATLSRQPAARGAETREHPAPAATRPDRGRTKRPGRSRPGAGPRRAASPPPTPPPRSPWGLAGRTPDSVLPGSRPRRRRASPDLLCCRVPAGSCRRRPRRRE